MEKNANQQLVEILLKKIERLEEENENLRRQLVSLLSRRNQESLGQRPLEIPEHYPVKDPFYYDGPGDFPFHTEVLGKGRVRS